MIAGHQVVTEPHPVVFAGCTWHLMFDMRAIWKLGQWFSPETADLSWLEDLVRLVARMDINAMTGCLWAGLLWENPRLTFEEALALLDEASPADLVALPGQILAAIKEAFGGPARGRGGQPWDWEISLAVWVKEWGRSEEEFWRTTFRTFSAISNGLAKLYDSAKRGGAENGALAEGWTLMDLAMMGRRRR